MVKKLNETDKAVKGKPSHSVAVSGFPKDLWEIWNRSCKKKYQDIRWIKMWSDHLKAQSYDLLIKSQFQVIEKTVEQTEEKEENELGLLNPEMEDKK